MVSNDWTRKAPDPLHEHCKNVIDKTWNGAGRCKTVEDEITNAVLGIGGEAGEIVDLHKKLWYHKEKNRRPDLLLEIGDLLYYTAKLIDLYGFTLDEILEANKAKLFERYGISEKR